MPTESSYLQGAFFPLGTTYLGSTQAVVTTLQRQPFFLGYAESSAGADAGAHLSSIIC